MVQGFSGNSGENEKRGIPLNVFPFSRKKLCGKTCSIWFPIGKTDFPIQMESALVVRAVSFECRKVIGFAFTTLRDWLKRFAPLFPLIRSKTKTNCVIASRFFIQSEVKPKPIVSLLPALCVSYM